MSRTVATVWHASLSTLAVLLYFLFVLPRWWELTGFAPHVLGTVMRVLLGLLVAAMALPVAAVLKQARKPEYGTPQLALSLRSGSIVAHLVAGALIAGTAVSEIWLSLDSFGTWLFGIYGAAAAIALLGIGAFYLAVVAEMPPPPPKPIKPKAEKQPKQGRRRGKKSGDETAQDTVDAEAEVDAEDESDAEAESDTEDADSEATESVEADGDETAEPEAADGDALRPSGKRRAKKTP
ncbi:eL24 family ribosomal protein [Mycolicibacter arupensis]|uniref:Membrane protein n=1 Tax=Mycolicibacter arupensis TaxID=342002 RepID=A0A0F5MWN2_9MYCO|nr:membrane protein [Mycolicibacter arupensis]KKB98452.1 membrane protein [Mycolicibacter arupensis]MCV7275120.1 hypothetical protein [Mycolicibacter arupensis]OQZ97798.1 hypothetical protein BST15_09835 [Mycolicibacter arupensis]TXI59052.1 MAG: hypothetical protein E6Q54_03815 [Mycolicibacter arupensis]